MWKREKNFAPRAKFRLVESRLKGCFPLGGILRAERNFSLSVRFYAKLIYFAEKSPELKFARTQHTSTSLLVGQKLLHLLKHKASDTPGDPIKIRVVRMDVLRFGLSFNPGDREEIF